MKVIRIQWYFLDHKIENQSQVISNNYKKRAMKQRSTEDYVPSFYESTKAAERRPVAISQKKDDLSFLKSNNETENVSYYAKLSKAKF